MHTQLLRLPQVIELVALSRSELYRRMKINEFPSPVSIGKRAVAWPASSVVKWIEARKPLVRTEPEHLAVARAKKSRKSRRHAA